MNFNSNFEFFVIFFKANDHTFYLRCYLNNIDIHVEKRSSKNIKSEYEIFQRTNLLLRIKNDPSNS